MPSLLAEYFEITGECLLQLQAGRLEIAQGAQANGQVGPDASDLRLIRVPDPEPEFEGTLRLPSGRLQLAQSPQGKAQVDAPHRGRRGLLSEDT